MISSIFFNNDQEESETVYIEVLTKRLARYELMGMPIHGCVVRIQL